MSSEEATTRAFKGVWIPKEIWLNDTLSLVEKVFLVEINSLDNEKGCFAGNEYFAKFFGLSKDRTRDIIANLVKKGYLTSNIEDGFKRTLRIRKDKIVMLLLSHEDDTLVENNLPSGTFQPTPLVENNHNNNIYNNTNNSNKIVTTLQQPKAVIAKEDKRNPDIQEVYEYGLSKGFVGVKQQYQRYAIKRLLGKIEKNKLLRLVDFTQQIRKDQFAPQVNTFLDMEYKLANLRDYMSRKQNKAKTIVKI